MGWRRGRDSNPRKGFKTLQRFSKPSRSATPAPLRERVGPHRRTAGNGDCNARGHGVNVDGRRPPREAAIAASERSRPSTRSRRRSCVRRGGGGGIRTREACTFRFSRPAPSTARPPLRARRINHSPRTAPLSRPLDRTPVYARQPQPMPRRASRRPRARHRSFLLTARSTSRVADMPLRAPQATGSSIIVSRHPLHFHTRWPSM